MAGVGWLRHSVGAVRGWFCCGDMEMSYRGTMARVAGMWRVMETILEKENNLGTDRIFGLTKWQNRDIMLAKMGDCRVGAAPIRRVESGR